MTNVKKTYAKIPGLFTGGAPLIPDKIDSQQSIPGSEYNYQQPPPPPQQQQESGKFSLSTFFPTGIIDKLQQTVYGENSTDFVDNSVPNYPPPPQQVQGYFESPSNIQGFFGGVPPTPPRQTTPFEVQSVPAFVPQFQPVSGFAPTPFEVQPAPAFVPQFQQHPAVSVFQQQPPVTSTAQKAFFTPVSAPEILTTPFESQPAVSAFVPQFQQQPPLTTTPQQSFFTPVSAPEIPKSTFESQPTPAFQQQTPQQPFTPATEIPSNISAPPTIPVCLPPPSQPQSGDRQNPYSIRGKKTFFNKNPHIETSAQPFSELLSTTAVTNPVNFFNPSQQVEESNFFNPIESEPVKLIEELKLSTPPPEQVEQLSEFPGLSTTTSFNTNLISPIASEISSSSFFSEKPPETITNFFKPIVESEPVKQNSEFPEVSTEVPTSFFNSSESVLIADPFNNYFKPIECELIKSEIQVEQFSDYPGLSSRNSLDSNFISEIGENIGNTEVVGDINLEEVPIDTLALLQQTSSILQHDLNKGK